MIIMIGIPGAGKTTLAKDICKNSKYDYLNFADIMLKIARKNGFKGTRDQIRKKMTTVHTKNFQIDTFLEIIRMEKQGKNYLVDTHGFIPIGNHAYVNGFPYEIQDTLKGHVDWWLFVFASPEELIKRISKDKKRKRKEYLNVKNIEKGIDMERAAILNYTILMGGNYIDINNDGPKGSMTKKIVKTLKK